MVNNLENGLAQEIARAITTLFKKNPETILLSIMSFFLFPWNLLSFTKPEFWMSSQIYERILLSLGLGISFTTALMGIVFSITKILKKSYKDIDLFAFVVGLEAGILFLLWLPTVIEVFKIILIYK